MEKSTGDIIEVFGNRLRVRVCGVCVKDGEILLVNHRGLNAENEFWAPPGGGMELGFSAEENLVREFHEETGLHIAVENFLGVHEFLGLPLHAIELFFTVKILGGTLVKGFDPEFSGKQEIIKEVAYRPWSWIAHQPSGTVHNFLQSPANLEALLASKGYFFQKVIK